MTWTVRLWQRNPQKLAGIMVAGMLGAMVGLWAFPGTVFGALLGFAFIAGATTDFWLPQHFTLDGTGARSRCGISVTSLEWEAVKRVYEMGDGVKLTPLDSDTRLEPFRGIFLRYENNREQVLETIRGYWKNDVRTLERGSDGGTDGGALG